MGNQLPGKTLLYHVADHNGGVVFAPEFRARQIDCIHRALRSKTWGEFRRLLPPGEYHDLLRVYEFNGDPAPEDSASFDPEMVPGWSDGDYPDWLQREMPKYIDVEVLSRHGVLNTTAVSGSFWWIAPDRVPAITSELTALGWQVRHAPELHFW